MDFSSKDWIERVLHSSVKRCVVVALWSQCAGRILSLETGAKWRVSLSSEYCILRGEIGVN